jgi:tRNA/tmRNA/rRNA uracil-C5-methylase (TrmA/RlmC/RlmD family)
VAGLKLGIAALPAELAARTEVVEAPAASARNFVQGAEVVIADPPRKGLDREILEALLEHRPERFLYVSCGLPSFLAQGRELLEGGFRLQELAVFDLFPFTDHVEVVASFG